MTLKLIFLLLYCSYIQIIHNFKHVHTKPAHRTDPEGKVEAGIIMLDTNRLIMTEHLKHALMGTPSYSAILTQEQTWSLLFRGLLLAD